ncbi:MAG: spore germination lipoprotein GerD [Sporolactobacillus sp.]
MRRITLLILLFPILLIIAGCGGNDSAHPSYQENKKMVLDMLKTDDGKKTIKELLEDKEMKTAIIFDEPAIKNTIFETFKSEQGKKLWTDLFKDPDFSEKLAQSMQKENENLLKRMMKDPGYQGMMMDVLKAPELQQQYLTLLRTKPFREQVQKDMQEMVASPLFKKELMDTISTTLKKQSEKP